MFRNTRFILSALLAAHATTASPLTSHSHNNTVQHTTEKPKHCFMTGSFEIPKDVATDLNVRCLQGPEPFKGVPDVDFENIIQYSVLDYRRDPKLSSVGFALKYFTPLNRDETTTHFLEGILAVYLATNAGLRSLGPGHREDVKHIKGPCFYLGFQLAISRGHKDVATHQLGKILKNCVGCRNEEKEAVLAIAQANFVPFPESLNQTHCGGGHV